MRTQIDRQTNRWIERFIYFSNTCQFTRMKHDYIWSCNVHLKWLRSPELNARTEFVRRAFFRQPQTTEQQLWGFSFLIQQQQVCWPGVEGADGHGDRMACLPETITSSEVTRSSGDGVLRKDKQCSHVSNSNMQTECVNVRKHYVLKAFCSEMELWPMKSLDDTHTHCCSNYMHLHVFLTSTATR